MGGITRVAPPLVSGNNSSVIGERTKSKRIVPGNSLSKVESDLEVERTNNSNAITPTYAAHSGQSEYGFDPTARANRSEYPMQFRTVGVSSSRFFVLILSVVVCLQLNPAESTRHDSTASGASPWALPFIDTLLKILNAQVESDERATTATRLDGFFLARCWAVLTLHKVWHRWLGTKHWMMSSCWDWFSSSCYSDST